MSTKTTKYKILSGSWLKIIAMTAMLIDHTAIIFMSGDKAFHQPYCVIGNYPVTDYFLCRNIVGRLAFPIFAFLIVEGYHHTSNRRRYAQNLLLFAIISIIPWNLVHGDLLYHSSQNVLFTLLFGVILMLQTDKITQYYSQNSHFPLVQTLTIIPELIAIQLLHTDYGAIGVVYIVLLHVLRGNILNQSFATFATFAYNKFHRFNILALIPLSMYNGKRGFIQGKWAKYVMYAFYPLHLIILWGISHL